MISAECQSPHSRERRHCGFSCECPCHPGNDPGVLGLAEAANRLDEYSDALAHHTYTAPWGDVCQRCRSRAGCPPGRIVGEDFWKGYDLLKAVRLKAEEVHERVKERQNA